MIGFIDLPSLNETFHLLIQYVCFIESVYGKTTILQIGTLNNVYTPTMQAKLKAALHKKRTKCLE